MRDKIQKERRTNRPLDDSNWTPDSLAWLAGLLEGEGSFLLVKGRWPKVQMATTDEDVARRARAIAGCGNVWGPYVPKNPKHKPTWLFYVSNQRHAVRLMRAIRPWMGERRTEVIDGVLAVFDERSAA